MTALWWYRWHRSHGSSCKRPGGHARATRLPAVSRSWWIYRFRKRTTIEGSKGHNIRSECWPAAAISSARVACGCPLTSERCGWSSVDVDGVGVLTSCGSSAPRSTRCARVEQRFRRQQPRGVQRGRQQVPARRRNAVQGGHCLGQVCRDACPVRPHRCGERE